MAIQRIRQFIAPLPLVFMLQACAVRVPGNLYPVQGPLSKESVPPVYRAALSGSVLPSGTVTVYLAPGVRCPGNWRAISRDDTSARDMASEWDSVYGEGYFIADVLGKRTFARAALSCSNGDSLRLEFLVVEPGEPTSTIGVVADKSGNLFKLTF